MKPVPFAEYLARHQARQASEPSPESAREPPLFESAVREPALHEPAPREPSWPPPRRRTVDEEAARHSPLLRKGDSARLQALRLDEDRPAPAPKLEQSLLKAFDEGREAMRREWADERSTLKEEIAEHVAREREKWAREEGGRLLEAHRAAIADFETRCGQAVANILRPFLTQAVIARVTDALVQNIEVLLASRRRSLFEISGPSDLLDALKLKFSDQPASIAYALSDGVDVRVKVDDTVIETQLGAWMQALGALASDAAQENASAQDAQEPPAARRRSRTRKAPNQEGAE